MFGKKDPESELRKLREQRAKLAAKLQELVQAVADRDGQIEKLSAGRDVQIQRLTVSLKALREQLDTANREIERPRLRR